MQLASWIAIYFVIWWICLFMVLPIGAHSQHDAGQVVQGTEPGAPALFRIWPKLVITTVLALAVLGLVYWGLQNPWLQRYVAVNR
jgi:predicted secreted protein